MYSSIMLFKETIILLITEIEVLEETVNTNLPETKKKQKKAGNKSQQSRKVNKGKDRDNQPNEDEFSSIYLIRISS